MQSSAAVAIRALIMLACVVGIPAFVFSGMSWSQILQKLQDFKTSSIQGPAATADSATLATMGDAPRFTSNNSAATDASGHPARLPITSSPNAVEPMPLLAPVAQEPSAVVPAEYQSPIDAAKGENYATDPFRSIQDRLRQLGASYYLLESWGANQQMYRFYCKMAIGGSADYTRCFEAAATDPLAAMTQVLRQVESWRSEAGNKELGRTD